MTTNQLAAWQAAESALEEIEQLADDRADIVDGDYDTGPRPDAWMKVQTAAASALALLRAAGMSSWEPIATASKVGGGKTTVLARGRYANPFDPSIEFAHAEVYYNRLIDTWLDLNGHEFIPAYWMPLPALPVTEGKP